MLEPLEEDRYDDWSTGYRQRVLDARQRAWERAADLALAADDPALAVEYASAAVAAEPLRESAVLVLVRALAASGDRASALARYDEFRRALADELGLDPTPRAEAVQAAVLRPESPSLDHPTGRKPAATELLRAPLPLVGRDAVMERLRGATSTPGPDQVAVIWLAGPSGSGKSRLLAQLVSESNCVAVRAFWADRAEPWTLARALLRELISIDVSVLADLAPPTRAALAGISPDIDSDLMVLESETRRALITEGIAAVCAGIGRTVIVDDVQWADPLSVRTLAGMVGTPGCPPLILAGRPEEVDATSGLEGLLHRVPLATRMTLGPLRRADIAGLLTDAAVAEAIADGTDRTPLAVNEVIRALAGRGALRRRADGRWSAVHRDAAAAATELAVAGQRSAISTRIDHHAGIAADALGLLAVLGREAPARTLAAAAHVEEPEMLAALTRLGSSDLVRPGEWGWRFSHDMVGEIVLDRLDVAGRTRFHALLAPVMDEQGVEPAERARHWLGARDLGRAGRAFAAAAVAAADAGADLQAERLADEGLALGHAVSSVDRATLRRARAEIRRRRGAIADARADLRAILDDHRTGPIRASALAELAVAASGADDLLRASELAELAIVEAGPDAPARARSLEVAAIIDMNLARPERSARRADEALSTYVALGDSAGAARMLDARAMAAFLHTDVRTGTDLLDRAATLFEDSGDLLRMVTPRSTRGHGLVLMAQLEPGLADATKALDAARLLGHQEGVAYALWHTAEALAALGRSAEAGTAAAESVEVALRIGHRGWSATGWRAVGLAHQAAGDLPAAADAFHRSLELSENLGLFGCWAAARIAIVDVGLGRLGEAGRLAAHAATLGPALGRHEARWSLAEVAVAQRDPAAGTIVADAIEHAESGGALLYLSRLRELAPRC